VDALRRDEVAERAKAAVAKYTVVQVHRVTRGTELLELATGHALLFDTSQLKSDDEEDAAAELHEQLRDWADIESELSPLQVREFAKSLNAILDHLAGRGLVVGAARNLSTRMRQRWFEFSEPPRRRSAPALVD
jgi:hypothetical protein